MILNSGGSAETVVVSGRCPDISDFPYLVCYSLYGDVWLMVSNIRGMESQTYPDSVLRPPQFVLGHLSLISFKTSI